MASGTMALIDRLAGELAAKDQARPLHQQPAFRRHWKAPRNSMGGFQTCEGMKAEAAAKAAAEYGPPAGPCPTFRSNTVHAHTPICFCGWVEGAHKKVSA